MGTKIIRILVFSLILLAITGCSGRPINQDISITSPNNTPDPNLLVSTCPSTDQDQYVYRPRRLQLLQSCVRAAGTVMDISSFPGNDGDMEFQLRLDAPYQSLLSPGNQDMHGYLQVEAICQNIPPVIEAIRVCASDPDPFLGPFPHIGDHIWVEGRYVLDLGHSAWAELHPLYRWGLINP
jgi:hypothetical protein